MKKIIICLVVAIFFSNCDIKVKESRAQEYHLMNLSSSTETVYVYKEFQGMRYLFASTYYGGSCVVNLTKDELEVELLRLQIAKLKQK